MMIALRRFIRSLKECRNRILTHRAERREVARTRRHMKKLAQGRLIIALYSNGMVRRRV